MAYLTETKLNSYWLVNWLLEFKTTIIGADERYPINTST